MSVTLRDAPTERGDRRIPLTGTGERGEVLRRPVLRVGDVLVEPVPL